jgi:hypothetical protein
MNHDRDHVDPALDALLRAHSAETPSAEVDATILAAAHRAVRSAPAEAETSAEATRPWRWWMPLAAAATIGAITIGVLQLAPKEPDTTSPIVSDTPSGIVAPAQQRAETPAAPTANDKSETPRVAAQAPRAKVRSDRATEAPAARAEVERAPAPQSFPAARDERARETTTAKSALADTQQRSAAEWIERIRALVTEGKLTEAAQELTAFRAAYVDADMRLPSDLQAWAATVKR